MRTLDTFLTAPIVERIAWTLLHFLWQGTALAALLGLALFGLRRRSAQSRYLVACITLLAMSLCPVVTLSILRESQPSPFTMMQETSDMAPAPEIPPPPAVAAAMPNDAWTPAPASHFAQSLDSTLPWIVILWLAGVGVLSVRLLGGWIVVQRLSRRAVRPVPEALHDSLCGLAYRIGIRRLPRLLVSDIVTVPTVIGCLRSVILLPAGVIAGLTPEMLETILLHELAHIRRYDYLVNLWQSAIETLLFYHPAVWWVSHTIRTEREHCCDDLVLEVLQDEKTYARALASLEALRVQPLALAATDGSLLRRIRRILGERSMSIKITPNVLLGVVGMTLICLGFFLYLKVVPHHQEAWDASASTAPTAFALGTPPAPAQPILQESSDDPSDFSGLTELHGPGIIFTLRDSQKAPKGSSPDVVVKYLIHDQDLQNLVNELFTAGAEAISIGNQRIVSRSVIRTVGPFIQINGTTVTTPFEIRAIGDPDALFKVAGLSYGPLSVMKLIDANMATLEKKDDVIVPAFRGDIKMHYAHPTAQTLSTDRAQEDTPSQAQITVPDGFFFIETKPAVAQESSTQRLQDKLQVLLADQAQLLAEISRIEAQLARLKLKGAEEQSEANVVLINRARQQANQNINEAQQLTSTAEADSLRQQKLSLLMKLDTLKQQISIQQMQIEEARRVKASTR